MCHFIKLKHMIINVSHIHTIQIKPNLLVIHYSPKNTYEIIQQENPTDYHQLQRWIDRLYVREI